MMVSEIWLVFLSVELYAFLVQKSYARHKNGDVMCEWRVLANGGRGFWAWLSQGKSQRKIAGFLLNFENKQIVKYRITVLYNRSQTWTIKRRYSDFLTIYSSIRTFYPRFEFAFPPKKTFGNLDAAVIAQRTTQLNRFVSD